MSFSGTYGLPLVWRARRLLPFALRSSANPNSVQPAVSPVGLKLESACRTRVKERERERERDQVFIGNQREQLQKEPAEARSSHINPGGDAMRWALREYGTNGCDVVSHKI